MTGDPNETPAIQDHDSPVTRDLVQTNALAPVVSDDSGRRATLLDQARAFVRAPQVVNEGTDSKRSFLLNKGLTTEEAERVLAELPPSIPPRTYPRPPPSNLPYLLGGIARVLTWVAGGSAFLILAYTRFILPRLTRSLQARQALVTHQQGLLIQLGASLDNLKSAQADTFAVLSTPMRQYEEEGTTECHTVDAVLKATEGRYEASASSDIALLRCAIEECLARDKQQPSADVLLDHIKDKADITSADQDSLYETLRNTSVFNETVDESHIARWSYTLPPTAPVPTKLETSLSALSSALPKPADTASSTRGLFQSLTDLTAFATSQAYAFSGPRSVYGDVQMNPAADEVRREIRALKGLVLNRKSFMGNRGTS